MTVFRASDPLVVANLTVDDGTGRMIPLNLTGMAVELYVKPRVEDADVAPLYSTTAGSIVVTDPASGLAGIQFAAADIADSGGYRYHLDTIASGRRVVRQWGALAVIDR